MIFRSSRNICSLGTNFWWVRISLTVVWRLNIGYDCGVFTCMFADFLSKDTPLVFTQEHINQCRERIALSIMNGKAIMWNEQESWEGEFRKDIRGLMQCRIIFRYYVRSRLGWSLRVLYYIYLCQKSFFFSITVVGPLLATRSTRLVFSDDAKLHQNLSPLFTRGQTVNS